MENKHTVSAANPLRFNTLKKTVGMDEKISQVVRLSEIGLNASFFFHEVRNILSNITIASYLTKKGVNEDNLDFVTEFLGEVDCGVLQINSLVEDMLSHSMKGTVFIESIDASITLGRTLNILAKCFKQSGITVEKQYGHDCEFRVRASETLLCQVFLNLLNNAMHAMKSTGSGGEIIIKIEEKNDNIQVMIQNTGPKIPEEVLPRIFEPFFTTKEIGQGTGLGLFFVKQTMENWGGKVTLLNKWQDGTTFVLQFLKFKE